MRTVAAQGAQSKAVRNYAAKIADGKTEAETLDNLDSSVRSVYRFRSEIEEIIRTPEFMLQDLSERGYLEGDCDDVSTFCASVLKALGFVVRFVAIRTDPSVLDFTHVFCEAQTSGKEWIRFDETVPNNTPLIYYGERMEQYV